MPCPAPGGLLAAGRSRLGAGAAVPVPRGSSPLALPALLNWFFPPRRHFPPHRQHRREPVSSPDGAGRGWEPPRSHGSHPGHPTAPAESRLLPWRLLGGFFVPALPGAAGDPKSLPPPWPAQEGCPKPGLGWDLGVFPPPRDPQLLRVGAQRAQPRSGWIPGPGRGLPAPHVSPSGSSLPARPAPLGPMARWRGERNICSMRSWLARRSEQPSACGEVTRAGVTAERRLVGCGVPPLGTGT